ncbi:unnamed protein product [Allacma fusca]|uniref:Uncharacterized protein n=1 Tax=Allacma fusca TaxID=39272 RepID=A0A8J2KC98_9HEXA|nr:unnamed protein product [Allacma fusca]
MHFSKFLALFLLYLSVGQSSKILTVTFFASKSFRNAFDPLFFELAERGHNVTIVSPINPSQKHANIREINLPPKEIQSLETSKFSNFFERRKEKEVTNIILAGPIILDSCRQFLEMKAIQELISEKFDLIVGVGLGNECSFGYIHQFNTSLILLSPITPIFALTDFIGASAPRSFVPSIFGGYSDNMNFFERMDNLLKTTWYTLYYSWIYLPTMDAMNREFFGPETPSVVDIAKNTSLVLVNSHLAVNYPRPFMPDLIDVGGLYCRPAKPLPKDIEDFVGSAQDGFIYFRIPMFGDQDYNVRVAENKQFGLKLELGEITESTLMASIKQVLDDPKYSQTAKTLSNVFRDRITQPLDTAVYWIEYVIRHRGAPQLRSPARDLNFFQYYCIDVVFVLLSTLLASFYVASKTLKLILTTLSPKVEPSKKKVKVK